MFQGLSVGGEWSGSVLMAGEWTDPKRRGFTTSFAQWGAPAGMVLANGALALMTAVTSEQQFLDWGWRIPFLASIVLVFVGLYIRIGILETPVFDRLKADGMVVKGAGRRGVEEELARGRADGAAPNRAAGAVLHLHDVHHHLRHAAPRVQPRHDPEFRDAAVDRLAGDDPAHRASVRRVRAPAHHGDRVLAMVVFPFVYFALLDTRVTGLAFLAIIVALPMQDLQYGPQAAFIAESFPGSLRYSGSSLGYQLASITAGGPAPIIALVLLQRFDTSMAVAAYVSVCALISLACVFALSEASGRLDHQ